MKDKKVTMKTGNKGLTVKINLFSINKHLDWFDWQAARLWMRGIVTNADTHKTRTFNDAGELISILGKWNGEKYKKLKAAQKK